MASSHHATYQIQYLKQTTLAYTDCLLCQIKFRSRRTEWAHVSSASRLWVRDVPADCHNKGTSNMFKNFKISEGEGWQSTEQVCRNRALAAWWDRVTFGGLNTSVVPPHAEHMSLCVVSTRLVFLVCRSVFALWTINFKPLKHSNSENRLLSAKASTRLLSYQSAPREEALALGSLSIAMWSANESDYSLQHWSCYVRSCACKVRIAHPLIHWRSRFNNPPQPKQSWPIMLSFHWSKKLILPPSMFLQETRNNRICFQTAPHDVHAIYMITMKYFFK